MITNILHLIKTINAGILEAPLRELLQYDYNTIINAIDDPSLKGNFYEIPIQLRFFLKLNGSPGNLYQFDKFRHGAHKKVQHFSDITGGGSGGGAVDVLFIDHNTTSVVGITSKYKKTETIGKTALEIDGVINALTDAFPKYKHTYAALVRDKQQLVKISNSNELHVPLIVYDEANVIKWWAQIQQYFINHPEPFDVIEKTVSDAQSITLALRNEQERAIYACVDYFKQGNERFLINAKMRFGKTIVALSIINSLKSKYVLMCTYFPNTLDQWVEDVNKFNNFNTITTINARDAQSTITLPTNSNNTTIVLTSVQDLKGFADKSKWQGVQDIPWDVIITDEYHFGVESDQTSSLLDDLQYKHLLALSGTPLKALHRGSFTPENTFHWTYIDEQKMKATSQEAYKWLPTMHMHGIHVPKVVYRNIQNVYDDVEGLTLSKVFATNDSGEFVYSDSVNDIVDMLCGMNGFRKELSPYHYGNTRTNGLRHTVWYLPSVAACRALETILQSHSWFRQFSVLAIDSDRYSAAEVLNVVRNLTERADEAEQCKGSITLSNKQMTTGASVPKWSAVFMMSDLTSPETYLQSIFRCQTENKQDDKFDCHVFDLNPHRCLTVMYNYVSSIVNNNEQLTDVLTEWLHYMPILTHQENTIKVVQIGDIINSVFHLSNTLHHIYKFNNKSLINIKNINEDALYLISGVAVTEMKGDSLDLFGNDDITTKKNTVNTNPSSRSSSSRILTIQQAINKSIAILQHIPWFTIYSNCLNSTFRACLLDIQSPIYQLVKEQLGVSPETILALLDMGVFNEEEINNNIRHFNISYHQNKQKTFSNVIQYTDSIIRCPANLKHTRVDVVETMLNTIPTDMWSNPDLKWYDPTCGKGNILIGIINRLIDGLRYIIPNMITRINHILAHMVYGVDKNEYAFNITRLRLASYGAPKFNLTHINNSEIHDTFDVIVSDSKQIGETTGTYLTQHTKLLSSHGYLIASVYASWLSYAIMKNSEIINTVWVDRFVMNVGKGDASFVVMRPIKPVPGKNTDFFNNQSFKYTCHIDTFKQIGFIPNTLSPITNDILRKITGASGQRFFPIIDKDIKKTSLYSKQSLDHFHPILHSSKNNWGNVKWSHKAHKYQYQQKIIISCTGQPLPLYDDGVYGVTENCLTILIQPTHDGHELTKQLQSKLYTFVMSMCYMGKNNTLHPVALQILPILDVSISWSNDKIFDFFNISQKEQKFINTMLDH